MALHSTSKYLKLRQTILCGDKHVTQTAKMCAPRPFSWRLISKCLKSLNVRIKRRIIEMFTQGWSWVINQGDAATTTMILHSFEG